MFESFGLSEAFQTGDFFGRLFDDEGFSPAPFCGKPATMETVVSGPKESIMTKRFFFIP